MKKIEANGKLYEIKDIILKNDFCDESILLRKKDLGYYDALIKSDTHYFLCNEILEIKFTEENTK